MLQIFLIQGCCFAGVWDLFRFSGRVKGKMQVAFSDFSVEVRSAVYDPNLNEDINQLVEKTLTDMALLKKGEYPALKFDFSFSRFFKGVEMRTSVIVKISTSGFSYVYLDEISTIKDRRRLQRVIRRAVAEFLKRYRK